MRTCEKCLNTDVSLNYYRKGEFLEYYQVKMFNKVSGSEDYIDFFTHFTKKEFLLCVCRTCSYSWISDTASNSKEPDS